MFAQKYKICDPIHGFIRFGDFEQKVIDSVPFQRLRSIHQMGVAYLVYPGAVHKRFEHSLGVMDLSSRIYQTIIAPHHQVVSLNKTQEELEYWHLILRLAALCHDLGHLPFSHTAEKELLPSGGHEAMTEKIICSASMRSIWKKIGVYAQEDILKLAVSDSKKKRSAWEYILMQVITDDNFGADRIDYLVRDGSYTGVGYGSFDYRQLIDTLRILPKPSCNQEKEFCLGVTSSGIQSVESLWIARYMMYARVYRHPKSRAYSRLMHRFMVRHYQGNMNCDLESYLEQNDAVLMVALAKAAKQGDHEALSLLSRQKVEDELPQECSKSGNRDFLVYTEEGKVIPSLEASAFLHTIPKG